MSRAGRELVVLALGQHGAQRRARRAQHVHGMRRGRDRLEDVLHRQGMPRRPRSFALYAASSATLGSLPCTSR